MGNSSESNRLINNQHNNQVNGRQTDQSNQTSKDSSKSNPSFLNDLISLLWSIGSYAFDVTCDAALILEYYRNGDFWYSGLTIAFVVIPAIIIAFLSSINYYERWAFVQAVKKTDDMYQFKKLSIVDSNGRFIFRFIFTILMMNPVARYYYALLIPFCFKQIFIRLLMFFICFRCFRTYKYV